MVDTRALQNEMKKNGHTLQSIANVIGRTRTCVFNKVHNKSEFRMTEINKIAMELKLKKSDVNRIFFAVDVE